MNKNEGIKQRMKTLLFETLIVKSRHIYSPHIRIHKHKYTHTHTHGI